MAATIRSFIAVHLSDHVREQIAGFQSRLKTCNADIKWVRIGSLHITLKFLGDIRPDQVDPVFRAIADAASAVPPFKLAVRGTGCFPNAARPRVLWLGIHVGDTILARLAESLNGSLSDLGFEKENRPFRPHLTLGRVRSSSRINEVVEAMMREGFESEPFDVDRVSLMQSLLKPSGALYSVLKEIKL
ncbi:RNA 2',3'-cyclic phosphodiesterase [bacterium]|nr:RNA 2',3'-cyclic phosphodiesterase [bacterium]